MSAGTSAHTASVWGNGKAALIAASHRKLEAGDEECMICRSDDVPASVSLLPCKHLVCIACVENMRAKNVFKVRARVVPLRAPSAQGGKSGQRVLKSHVRGKANMG
jgi:hypothetical protein